MGRSNAFDSVIVYQKRPFDQHELGLEHLGVVQVLELLSTVQVLELLGVVQILELLGVVQILELLGVVEGLELVGTARGPELLGVSSFAVDSLSKALDLPHYLQRK